DGQLEVKKSENPDDVKEQVVETALESSKETEFSKAAEVPDEQEVSSISDDMPAEKTVPDEIGRVTDVSEDKVVIRLTTNMAFEKSLIDTHVIFTNESTQKIIGTVTSINRQTAIVQLIGEIVNDHFLPGVITKPLIGNVCLTASMDETKLIVVNDQNSVVKKVLIGNMPLYNNTPAYVPINTFFSNHFAIFGNSGSGKSCGVARLFQNIFFNQSQAPKNAFIFIFDAYGEYESALSIQNNQVFFKKYTTNVNGKPDDIIKIPLWLLDMDDFALLLDADDATQIPIIEKALRLVTVFAGNEEDTRIYKNDIIAKAILEVLYSGGAASQIHDQVFAILTSFSTTDLNLESQIIQPGYTRSLRQCLIIDKEGKINEIQLVSEFIKRFINDSLRLELPDGTIPFTLENLREAFEFALISEGIFKSDKIYDKTNVMKVRLDSLIKSEYAEYFNVDHYVDKTTFIRNLITTSNGQRSQIINMNISYLNDRLAKIICKIYSKLLFDFASKLQNRGSFPVHIILEEAHRYVQQDSDIKILGYNIFDRIAKEGRKYGVILGLISQRPSELSETALSQCSNFLIFKMQHPRDVSFIRQMVPNITDEIIEKLKGLQPGTCVAFGSAFKLPLIIKMELPYPLPLSQNVDVSRLWY
ncbi:MAG: ATP-binding protein, partial [Bacilli bacterium]